MLKGQVSFFAIAGLVIVILTGAMLATTSRISAVKFEQETLQQSILQEDSVLLEWYMDELIRFAVFDSVNSAEIEELEVEGYLEAAAADRIDAMFDNSQFNQRGAGVLRANNAVVRLIMAEKNMVADVTYPVTLQRAWGAASISSRSIKLDYNLKRLFRFAEQNESEIPGDHEFEGTSFNVSEKDNAILIKDRSFFWMGKPIEVIVQ